MFSMNKKAGIFLDILKKTQARKNSKLKRILMKTQCKISEKLKNRQFNLSFCNSKGAFSFQISAAV